MSAPAWIKQLKAASFRNVPFSIDSAERSPGLNTVLREYPFQDLPTVFSMGEAAEEIKFSAYVIGGGYMARRDALEKALKQQESGVLMHPTIGAVRVWHHGKFSIKENPTAEGGIARFDLTFVRGEPRRYPLDATNTTLSSLTAALEMVQAAVEAFTSGFDLSGVAGWVRSNVLDVLLAIDGMIWDVAMAIKGSGGTDGLAELLRIGRASKNTFEDILLLPKDIARRFTSMLGLDSNLTPAQAAYSMAQLLPHDAVTPPVVWLSNAMPIREASLPSLIDVVLDVPTSPYATESRAIEAASIEAVQTLVQRVTYAALICAAAQAEFDNYDVAFNVRRAIHAHGTRLLHKASTEAATATIGDMANGSIHDALLAAHRAGLSHVQAQSIDLARLITFTPTTEESIWSISYQMYGTPEFADEVQAMNSHIINPLLVPAGVSLRLIDHE